MNFEYTEEQTLLRNTLSRYFADAYDFEARRKMTGSDAGRDPAVWTALAEELGILGAAFSEEQGGLGGGALENMLIMEEFGKALAVEPYLSTVVVAGGFLKRSKSPAAEGMIEKIISGEAIVAFAYAEPTGRYDLAAVKTEAKASGGGYTISGQKSVVAGAPWATHFVVTAKTAKGVAAFLVEAGADGISMRSYPTVDGGMAAEVQFDGVSVGADALLTAEDGLADIELVVDEATVAACAEAVGCLHQLHAQTMQYAKERKQFGRAIADFQVLQHRMVDMFMEVEQAVSMTLMATLKLGEDAKARAAAVSLAKAKVGRACKFVGENAIQIHGGMGMTDELAVGHYFKRATILEGLFGSIDHHLARYEKVSF